jgi:acyl-CoA synthetase (AMP-forming)/AMP-acid ligase II
MKGLVAEAFRKVSAEHSHRIAVYALSENLTRTFADIEDDANALHRALGALRLPPNPTIVSNVGNRTGFVPLFVAALGSGSGFLPLDGGASPREVFDLADACSADLIVIAANADGGDAWSHVESEPLPCGLAAIRRTPADGPWWRAPGETDALVLKVTSGSSGFSKVAVTPERSVISDGRHVIEAMDISSRDIGAATVPMAHSYGMGNLLLPLITALSTPSGPATSPNWVSRCFPACRSSSTTSVVPTRRPRRSAASASW